MTPLQREALQMCLEYIETDAHERRHVRWKIQEALAEPQPEPVASKLLKQEEEIKSLRNDLRRAHDAYCQLTREPPYTLHIPTSTQAADG